MARPKLTLLPYQPGDIDRFTPRDDFAAEKRAVAWAWPEGPPPGHTWTLREFHFNHSEVLGVGGVTEVSQGRWQAWALLSHLTPRQWCVAGVLVETALQGVERFNHPTEITASARASIPGAEALLEKLGFRPGHVFFDHRMGSDVLYKHMIRAA